MTTDVGEGRRRRNHASAGVARPTVSSGSSSARETSCAHAASDARTGFVRKHRKRLVGDASKAKELLAAENRQKLAEAEQLLDALKEARDVELWASLFPSERTGPGSAGRQRVFGGRIHGEFPWLSVRTDTAQIYALLRADAVWQADAATPEQRAELEGRDPGGTRTLSGSSRRKEVARTQRGQWHADRTLEDEEASWRLPFDGRMGQ